MYGEIPYVGKPVSRIFFGTAIAPFLAGEDRDDLLDQVLKSGINGFDMAQNYQQAEKVIGRWMERRGCRGKLVLLSKCGHPDSSGIKRINEAEIRKDFAESSSSLQTDYIDIYLLHRDDPSVPAGTIVETMNALHAEGKIGAFGGSNWTHKRVEEANEYAYAHGLIPFSVSSPNFGLAEQISDLWGGGCVSISGPQNTDAREWYIRTQMPVIAYSSLGRGLFSGRVSSLNPKSVTDGMDSYAVKGYASPKNLERLRRCEILAAQKGVTVSQLALRWIFNQKINTFAVVGTQNQSRIRENLESFRIDLSQTEAEYLNLEPEEPI
ncbi:MAG: aldo/keto reductase [Clostridia bacterium]|nr:aldo/keto reductase [Clostridia bacterium]